MTNMLTTQHERGTQGTKGTQGTQGPHIYHPAEWNCKWIDALCWLLSNGIIPIPVPIPIPIPRIRIRIRIHVVPKRAQPLRLTIGLKPCQTKCRKASLSRRFSFRFSFRVPEFQRDPGPKTETPDDPQIAFCCRIIDEWDNNNFVYLPTRSKLYIYVYLCI